MRYGGFWTPMAQRPGTNLHPRSFGILKENQCLGNGDYGELSNSKQSKSLHLGWIFIHPEKANRAQESTFFRKDFVSSYEKAGNGNGPKISATSLATRSFLILRDRRRIRHGERSTNMKKIFANSLENAGQNDSARNSKLFCENTDPQKRNLIGFSNENHKFPPRREFSLHNPFCRARFETREKHKVLYIKKE